MKEIYEKYKDCAGKYYAKPYKITKDIWKHVEAADEFAQCFLSKTTLDEREKYLIRLGCILHDIGRTKKVIKWYKNNSEVSNLRKKKDHHIIGYEYLKKSDFFDQNSFSETDKEIILRMVRYHKGKFDLNEVTENLNEHKDLICFAIAAVGIADKLANGKI